MEEDVSIVLVDGNPIRNMFHVIAVVALVVLITCRRVTGTNWNLEMSRLTERIINHMFIDLYNNNR